MRSKADRFKNKVAIVTGGGMGLGKARRGAACRAAIAPNAITAMAFVPTMPSSSLDLEMASSSITITAKAAEFAHRNALAGLSP